MVDSGKDCLAYIEKNKIEVVLLDIMMPVISGYDVLRSLREKFCSNELPVIMVTAKENPEHIISTLNIGANDYLTKPVQFGVAIARINTQLRLVDLTKEMSDKKELEAINAMITTYNHEINNPLSIAFGCVQQLEQDHFSEEYSFKTLMKSLERIRDVVKKIQDFTTHKDINYDDYTKDVKMIKIK